VFARILAERYGASKLSAPHPAAYLFTGYTMNITLGLGPLFSLIAGILILIMPRLLNYIVAIYLILIGLVGLFGLGHEFHLH
jgi:general stress protein CsbA